MKAIIDVLNIDYGLAIDSLEPVVGGWSALAYRAVTPEGDYFVKVYDKHRPSVAPWIARIDDYMPIVMRLHENAALAGNMVAPILTKCGEYKVEDCNNLILVFPFIEGSSIDESRISPAQARKLAGILAVLHMAEYHDIPIPSPGMREDYVLPFYTKLTSYIENVETPGDVARVLNEHSSTLLAAMGKAQDLGDELRATGAPLVLCHTDVHGWNLIKANRLILADWEGLRLAPEEAGLFSFTGGFFFDYAAGDFFAAYDEARGGYAVNERAMAFYRLRRRLEDIAGFADSIINDDLAREERERSMRHLIRECEALSSMRELSPAI